MARRSRMFLSMRSRRTEKVSLAERLAMSGRASFLRHALRQFQHKLHPIGIQQPSCGSYQEPCSCTDTSGFDEKDDAKHNVDIGVGKEGHGEGRSNQLPRDGGKNGGDDSSKESQVEELLDTVRNAKDVVVNTNLNIQSGDTGNDEKAKCDGHLTTDHESELVASLTLGNKFTSLAGNLGDLGNSKKAKQ
eukprot:scaffold6155_cov108-Cylindrotheca_fusiformis.AAC.4